MPSLSQRTRKLTTRLLAIRLGPGALLLPKEIKRIHLRFGEKINGGMMGPRKFWRHELVRMKFHNPAVPMTVDRIPASAQNEATEATLSIHWTAPDAIQTSASATSSPASTDSTTAGTTPSDSAPVERVEVIDMKHRTNSEILTELIRRTRAVEVKATPEEEEELRGLEEARVRGDRDRQALAEHRARVRREREVLEQGRNDIAAAQAA